MTCVAVKMTEGIAGAGDAAPTYSIERAVLVVCHVSSI
jgi:hypothetical protein